MAAPLLPTATPFPDKPELPAIVLYDDTNYLKVSHLGHATERIDPTTAADAPTTVVHSPDKQRVVATIPQHGVGCMHECFDADGDLHITSLSYLDGRQRVRARRYARATDFDEAPSPVPDMTAPIVFLASGHFLARTLDDHEWCIGVRAPDGTLLSELGRIPIGPPIAATTDGANTVYALVAGVVFATRFTLPTDEGGESTGAVEGEDLWVTRVHAELDSTVLYDPETKTLAVTDGETVLRCADGAVLRSGGRRADIAVEVRGRGVLLKASADKPGWVRFDPEHALPGEPKEREFVVSTDRASDECPPGHRHPCRHASK